MCLHVCVGGSGYVGVFIFECVCVDMCGYVCECVCVDMCGYVCGPAVGYCGLELRTPPVFGTTGAI